MKIKTPRTFVVLVIMVLLGSLAASGCTSTPPAVHDDSTDFLEKARTLARESYAAYNGEENKWRKGEEYLLTVKDVEVILGEPTKVRKRNGVTYWFYEFSADAVFVIPEPYVSGEDVSKEETLVSLIAFRMGIISLYDIDTPTEVSLVP